MALNFPEPVWISCEISQNKKCQRQLLPRSGRTKRQRRSNSSEPGSHLVQKSFYFKIKIGRHSAIIAARGVQIKVKVNVEFNERYGLKLIIEDIDPAYTLGQMEITRQKILERLKNAGVTEKNKSLIAPKVIQRIAVISSDTAAGFKDFTAHLNENKYGYQFKATLFTAAMQGMNTEKEVVDLLTEIKEAHKISMLLSSSEGVVPN